MSCPSPETLAAWVDGEVVLDPQLREHTRECALCAATADQMRAVTRALPQLQLAGPAPRFTRELEAKLNDRRHQRQLARRALVAAASMAVVCAAAVGLATISLNGFEHARSEGEETFSARGDATRRGSRLGFEIYAHEPGRQPVRIQAGQQLQVSTGYSFVVINRSQQQQRAMLFALDARGEVHWFYPAFLDPAADPQSIVVAARPQQQPLPDGITPDSPAPGPIRFVGVFSKTPLRVSEVEASLRSGGLQALTRAHSDADIQSLQAELRAEP